MATPNEVKSNIRHNILLLREFTVPQLEAITGFGRQSIHIEVRCLEQEGFVSQVGTQERAKGSVDGRPLLVYQLSSDPETRFQLLQFVRAFYVAGEQTDPMPVQPESKHYFIAQEILDEALENVAILTQEERTTRLNLIRERLEYARQEEEVGTEGTQLIAASLDLLEAKAVDALGNDLKSTVRQLVEVRKACQEINTDDLVTH